jgi:hypothetical protein
MEIAGWEIIRLELKYCERCGGLWLRPRGEGQVYCAVCSSEIPDLLLYGRRIRRPRWPAHVNLEGEGQNGGVRLVVCGEEGHA